MQKEKETNTLAGRFEELQKVQTSRRDFLKYFLTTAGAAFAVITAYPVVSFLKPPKQREVEVSSVSGGKVDELKAGEFKIVRFGNKPVIVINEEGAGIKAFSATCTHLDCTVQYKKEEKVIWCACHNGKYDMQGRNISGPPPRPLDKYLVKIRDNEIMITKG